MRKKKKITVDQAVSRWSELMPEVDGSVPTFRAGVGTRLRKLEASFNNRSEAAEAAGVAKSTLQRWINGGGDASFEGLARLAYATGVSLDWIAFGKEQATQQAGSGAEALPVDVRLLATVTALVEDWLDANDREMEPGPKAEVIAELYAFVTEEAEATNSDETEVAKRSVAPFLRLVSSR